MGRQKPSQLPSIGKAELEVLQFIHSRHPVTVREVADHLGATRGLVRTTALNVMNRLVQKGYLTRKRVEGVFQYVPVIPQGKMLKDMVREFVEGALGGSVSPFVAYLSQEAKQGGVSDAELEELRKLVSELEDRR